MPDDIEIKPLIADGKARTQEHAPPDKRDIRRRLQWKRIERWALALFTGLPALFIAGWLVISLTALLTHRHNLDIDEIGVPETLSKAGFTLTSPHGVSATRSSKSNKRARRQ